MCVPLVLCALLTANKKKRRRVCKLMAMEDQKAEVYFVFMNYDPEYQRRRVDRSKEGKEHLDCYLSRKHDQLLAEIFQPNTYRKLTSMAIVDGFSVEITQKQAAILRNARDVRVVDKNQELA